ncbi:MBF2 family protein, partial [Nocardioides abyssi]
NGQNDHNIYQCPDPSTATKLLYQKDVKENGKFLAVLTETIDFPESGVNPNKITCIIVTNKLGENGGYANIVSGGLNDYKTEIVLKSQTGKGLDYHIEIYSA